MTPSLPNEKGDVPRVSHFSFTPLSYKNFRACRKIFSTNPRADFPQVAPRADFQRIFHMAYALLRMCSHGSCEACANQKPLEV